MRELDAYLKEERGGQDYKSMIFVCPKKKKI